ncbi:cAMP-binding protein [Arcticibacter svalbardensis MN12-7]|uniref:cAMP-binding protein n=1 Tax=Arcticibacter svalbardensis MN12-7 TaxID=1150600 RepID=R9GYC7_9SPHI|nr:Crp/Fnr family transcriptional regulator [Arcticibacter svalbardensis]EOR96746.1 cAMP-binding protein [Arcticibacter svalbardensis MN12-7]
MGLLDFIASYNLQEISFAAKTIILQEGNKAKYIYFVKKGCLRMWLNNRDTDITTQFFFEGSAIASLESLLKDEASDYTIETIEACSLFVMSRQDFLFFKETDESFKIWLDGIILERFFYYSKHLVSYLRTKPYERYIELLHKHPEILQRIPQHYIASYLGITPVSLSRIRSRK